MNVWLGVGVGWGTGGVENYKNDHKLFSSLCSCLVIIPSRTGVCFFHSLNPAGLVSGRVFHDIAFPINQPAVPAQSV